MSRSRSVGTYVDPRFYLLILFVMMGTSVILRGQTPTAFLMTGDTSRYNASSLLMIEGNGSIGSNVLDVNFFRKSLFGGHLENSHLNQLSEKSRNLNRAGFYATGGLDYYNFTDSLFGNPDRGLKIGVHSAYHASMSYSKDLFNLIYRGNALYRGDSVQLDPLSAEYQAWQKFSVGIFNKKTLSSVSIGLVAGDNYQSLIVNDANLFTSMSGDSLALNYRGEYISSDTTKKGWANGSGLGLAVDLDYNLPIADGKGMISVALRDIGFIGWNNRTRHIAFDSTTIWTGVAVNDVFELDSDSIDFPNLTDSIHRKVSHKSYVAMLPMSIFLRYAHYFSAKGFYDISLNIWPNRAALPQASAGISYMMKPNIILTGRASFGGYGTWGVGGEIQYFPRNSWLFRLGCANVPGYISDKSVSRDLYFSVARFFKPRPKSLISEE